MTPAPTLAHRCRRAPSRKPRPSRAKIAPTKTTSDLCDHCGAMRRLRDLAPYYVGDVRRVSCEAEECRERSRAELRAADRAEAAA